MPRAWREIGIARTLEGADAVRLQVVRGPDPRAARDRAVAAGIVVNGLVIGGGRGLADYFGTHVRGGAGSFVLEVAEPAALIDAMIEKLLRDLVAVRQAGNGAVPIAARTAVPLANRRGIVTETGRAVHYAPMLR